MGIEYSMLGGVNSPSRELESSQLNSPQECVLMFDQSLGMDGEPSFSVAKFI